jgi:hypothetical protein
MTAQERAIMTTSPKDNLPANSNPAETDELTAIHGISPDRATKLRESGIDTLQKLADISDEKAAIVAATIKYVSAQMIRDWRAEARELLSQPQDKGKVKAQTETKAEPEEWRSIASFSVAFQSRRIKGQGEERRAQIVHRQGDGPRFFYDIDSDKPWRWILGHLGERSQPQAAPYEGAAVQAQTTEPSPAAEPSIQAKIAGVRVFQPPQAGAPIEASTSGKLFQGCLHGDEPFALEATVRLTGPGSSKAATEQQACRAQLFARPLPPGMPIDLGNMRCDALSPDKPAYMVRRPKASLPSGVYHLQVMITIQGAGIVARPLDGPVLQVV